MFSENRIVNLQWGKLTLKRDPIRVRISAYTNQSRVSHSVRMREKVLRCTLSSLAWSGAS